ncbi:hypothetical protein BDD12DRAFT_887731 [Trichophaea hybrida]|nr:hypothetical protein BDD12DRAFT_887731 [Trichophaea hybrida]
MDSPAPTLSSASSSSSPSFSTASSGRHRKYPKSAYPVVLPPISPEDLDDTPNSHQQLLWPTERLPYYGDSGKFLGTMGIRMKCRPIFPSSHRTQRRYAQAILSSMPVDGRDPGWADGINGAAGGLWETGGNMFPEEKVSIQLRQYSEMFSYLSRLYENAQGMPKRAEQIVRRGAEILAAVRLLAGQPQHYHSPAGGTEARNPSQVSVWGWKPYREIALAERVNERRRLRAAEARAKAREEKTLSKRGPSVAWKSWKDSDDISVSSTTQPVSSSTAGETRARIKLTWAEKELEKSRRRREKSKERLWKESNISDMPNLYGGDAGYSSRETPPPLWIYSQRRETIHWNYPDYHNGYDIPALNLPLPLEDRYTNTTATVTSGDSFLRSHTIKEATETISLPYSQRRPPSEPVSPKTTPTTSPYDSYKHTSEEPSSSAYVTTDSEQLPPITELRSPETYRTVSSSDSFGSGSLRLRRFRSAFKSAFPSVPRLPWSSSSQTSNSISEPNSAMTSPTTLWRLRGVRTPWTSRRNAIRPTNPPPEQTKAVSDIALLSNKTTTTERLPQHATAIVPAATQESEDKLTRTEREYQEVLEALQQLKREMRLEREAARSERRRSRSRGRPLERIRRSGTSRSASGGTVKASRGTIRWWLDDVA